MPASAAGQRPASQAFPGANREDRAGGYLAPKTVTREAAKVLADLGLDVRPARVRILVKRFIETGRSDLDFRTWVIAYADPTGETAARNADRDRGRAHG